MRDSLSRAVESERRASLILFDLGALNLVGWAGVSLFHSAFLWSWGFRRTSVLPGLMFISLGLLAGRLPARFRRLHVGLYAALLLFDVWESTGPVLMYERAPGLALIQVSLILPSVCALYLLLRSYVTGARRPTPEDDGPALHPPQVLHLLSSTVFSVGCGLGLLLAFAVYGAPILINSTNPFLATFHDLILVPAILLCFPVGLAAGELLWLLLCKSWVGRRQIEDCLRYLWQTPFVGPALAAVLDRLDEREAHAPRDGARTWQTASPELRLPSEVRRPSFARRFLKAAAFGVLIAAVKALVLIAVYQSPGEGRAMSSPRAFAQVPNAGIVVSQKGDAQHITIQSAVNYARPGDTIIVRPGVYAESVTLDKAVHIVGDWSGGAAVVVECSTGPCLRSRARGASVKNLQLRMRAGFLSRMLRHAHFPVVEINGGNLLLESADITSNVAFGGVVSGQQTAPRLKGVVVHDLARNGVLYTDGAGGVLEDSEIFGTSSAGLRVERGSDPLILRSKFHHSRMSGIIFALGGAGRVEECEVYENRYANIDVREESRPTIRRTRVFGGRQSGIFFREASTGLVEESDIFGNAGAGVYVAERAAPEIRQSKIHDCGSSGIYVHEGGGGMVEDSVVYENRSTGVTVRGESGFVLRRLTVRANDYSGVEISDGADPLVEECRIYGGGMSGLHVYGGGRGKIVGSEIHSHVLANVAVSRGGNPHISRSKIYGSG